MNTLKNECGVSIAFDPSTSSKHQQMSKFMALWDTGATGSVISQKVVDDCGLVATGMAQVHGPDGPYKTETYLVNIYLPNSVMINSVRATKGTLRGFDVLVGMDIINHGDFAVTNKDGNTKFSFRVPSITDIDFVVEHKAATTTQHAQAQRTSKKRAKKRKTYGKNKK